MSLAVTLDVGGRTVSQINVQRVRSAESGVHPYTVVSNVDGVVTEAHFKHRESDGALACLTRAVEAIEVATHAAAVSSDPHAQARAAFNAFAHTLPLVPRTEP